MSRKGKRRREASRLQRQQRVARTEAEGSTTSAGAEAAPARSTGTPARSTAAAKTRAPRRPRSRVNVARYARIGAWLAAALVTAGGIAFIAVVVLSGSDDSGAVTTPSRTPDPRVGTSTPTAGQSFTIELAGNADTAQFIPATLQGKAGAVIEILAKNTGTVAHNVRVSGPNKTFEPDEPRSDDFVSDPQTIQPGEEGRVLLKLDTPGNYPFRCDFHPQQQISTLTIQ
jgi:plastocyanin